MNRSDWPGVVHCVLLTESKSSWSGLHKPLKAISPFSFNSAMGRSRCIKSDSEFYSCCAACGLTVKCNPERSVWCNAAGLPEGNSQLQSLELYRMVIKIRDKMVNVYVLI